VIRVLAALACAAACGTLAAEAPFAPLKGRIKEGRYEFRTETDMSDVPGVAPGTAIQVSTVQSCVKASEIEQGGFTLGRKALDSLCKVRDFNLVGDKATYSMACDDLESEVRLTLVAGGYDMELKTTSIEDKGRSRYNTVQKLRARYLGECGKGKTPTSMP
jgi:Protein of unknown function (DUF3617)